MSAIDHLRISVAGVMESYVYLCLIQFYLERQVPRCKQAFIKLFERAQLIILEAQLTS